MSQVSKIVLTVVAILIFFLLFWAIDAFLGGVDNLIITILKILVIVFTVSGIIAIRRRR